MGFGLDMDEIKIVGLEVFAHHGVYPEENEKGQNFVVNATLYTDAREAGKKDDLELSTDYGEVCHFIEKIMKENTYKLIETVAEKVSQEILLRFENIKALDMEILKPNAPIGLLFDYVSAKIHRRWHSVYISIGSNIGDREKYINDGIKKLKQHNLIRNVKVSELIVTKPYGGVCMEDFLNGAIALETLLSPTELLSLLHDIEAAAGRERVIRWGSRTLDLDIVFYDKLVYEDEDLIIPHIDMENREFVLSPLSQLAPNFRHPVLGETVMQLLSNLQHKKI